MQNDPYSQQQPYTSYNPQRQQQPYPPNSYPPQQPYSPQPYLPQEPYPYGNSQKKNTNVLIIILLSVGLLALCICGAIFGIPLAGALLLTSNSQGSSTNSSHFNSAYPLTDNISCDSLEYSTVHYHIHVSIYIDGKATQIPQNIGIAPDTSCLYWLHTHDQSGIIHIEAPSQQKFTLGNFLDIWQRHFANLGAGYPQQFDQTGWTIYANGQAGHDTQRSLQLSTHELITLAYNSPDVKPDTTYSWGQNL